MKLKEFKGLSVEELREKEKAFKKQLFGLSYERKMGRVEKPSQFKSIKRSIARVLTIIRERELKK